MMAWVYVTNGNDGNGPLRWARCEISHHLTGSSLVDSRTVSSGSSMSAHGVTRTSHRAVVEDRDAILVVKRAEIEDAVLTIQCPPQTLICAAVGKEISRQRDPPSPLVLVHA